MTVTTTVSKSKSPLLVRDLRWFLGLAKPRRLRSMRQFAEQEIVLPSGPFAGRRFTCARQPYTSLWFDQLDGGQYTRFIATGPTQSGKTLCCFVIPLLYHLFEIGETVICGLPDMDMAADKWREDLLPVIERSRYKDQLPSGGGGSRGGRVESLTMNNGATLKFMSGGGGDKSRAGFTARVLVITETDGMDRPGMASRESDKITQLEARTRAYGNRKRVYMECTLSTESGRTWQEYANRGTHSRIALPCPHCKALVTPEREHLVGWKEAASEAELRKLVAFACPGCGGLWTESDRLQANRTGVLVHEGQKVNEQQTVQGLAKETDTLGFRWSAVNNLFLTTADAAADEWRAAHAPDPDIAEREMRQFVWCLPVASGKQVETELEVNALALRTAADLPRGIAPGSSKLLTAAIDLGKYLAHWVVVAWSANATGHVVDYGRLEVAGTDLGLETAIMATLKEFAELVTAGWPVGSSGGQRLVPEQAFVDGGYMAPVVYAFCRSAGQRFRPSFGRGASQQKVQWLDRVTQTGSTVKLVGEGYHASWLPAEQLHVIEADADHWKSWVHGRLATPVGQPGAMTLYHTASPQEHLSFVKHLTAEVRTEQFIAGKGVQSKWERIRKQNHWLDALYNACVAGHGCGVRLVEEPAPPPAPEQPRPDWSDPRQNPLMIPRRW